jgi:hypothetical protein
MLRLIFGLLKIDQDLFANTPAVSLASADKSN